jgi:outer membrane protein
MKTPLARSVKFTDDRRSKPQQAAAGYRGDDMKFSTLSKAGFAASLCAALTGWSTGVQAGTLQDTIFAKVEPSVRDRMFFRLSYIVANVKTTSKDAYDVTGPVLARGDIDKYIGDGQTGFVSGFTGSDGNDPSSHGFDDTGSFVPSTYSSLIKAAIENGMTNEYANSKCAAVLNGLGTPCGIKAKSSARVGTPALSVGYFLDDDHGWALEAFLLAKPIKASVYGEGKNGLNGQKIVETNLLPPVVLFGKYFGNAKDEFRPYLGLAASYAIFYGAKATQALNKYQGGASASDTTVSIKNAEGFGPFVGLNFQPKQSDWNLNFSLGKLRYKTVATLVTKNTTILSDSAVLKDFGVVLSDAIRKGNNVFSGTVNETGTPAGYKAGDTVTATTALMCDLARAKYGNNDCSHGTFVRKTATTLDNTMFVFSVGRSF